MLKKLTAVILALCLAFCLFSCSKITDSSPLKSSQFISSGVDEKTKFRYDEYEDYIIVTGVSDSPDNIEIPKIINNKEVRAVGDNAFSDMGWVKTITIPDTVSEIGDSAFYGSVSVTKISLPESLYKIGTSAFEGCSNLQSIRLPLSLKEIGGFAFAECEKLEGIAVPNGVSSIGGGAFTGTKWLSQQKDEFVIAGDGVLIAYNGSDEKITVPEGVKEVSAFYDSFFAVEITFPESVEKIGEYAFINSSVKTVKGTENVKKIGKSAFDSCLNLKEISFGDKLEKIGMFAFTGCQLLESFTVNKSVEFVGDGVFSRCDALKKLTFVSPKTEIGENICESCSSTLKISCPKNSPVIDYTKENGFVLDIV